MNDLVQQSLAFARDRLAANGDVASQLAAVEEWRVRLRALPAAVTAAIGAADGDDAVGALIAAAPRDPVQLLTLIHWMHVIFGTTFILISKNTI